MDRYSYSDLSQSEHKGKLIRNRRVKIAYTESGKINTSLYRLKNYFDSLRNATTCL